MEKEFIPYGLALELKGLGFDEPCFATIDQTDYLHINGTKKLPRGSMMYDTIDCLTFSQVFRWFREKYKLFHNTLSVDEFRQDVWWECKIYGKTKNRRDIMCQPANTYEEAELECSKKLIEIVKDK